MFLSFFFNNPATTQNYTLSLHDALPISLANPSHTYTSAGTYSVSETVYDSVNKDRKSTRLNSSHSQISYAVFCLKKKTRAGPNSAKSRPLRGSGGAGRFPGGDRYTFRAR